MNNNNPSSNNRRVAKNTLLLYMRMFFAMVISLYSSKVILQALGVEGYGIYSVVGGFVGFFSILSSSLSAAVSRFLTYEIGRARPQELREVFATSLFIHAVMAGILVLAFETVGLWYVNTQLVLPEGRLGAAHWVFQASILTFVVGILNVPYTACIIAHERMNIFAFAGITDISFKLLIALKVAYVPSRLDPLVEYAWLLCAEGVLLQAFYYGYCRRTFDECDRWRLHYAPHYLRQISAFAGWNFIGSSACVLKTQGIALLLNAFFGVVLNSARGMADTVNAACSAFANNFMTALNPQITKSYAQGRLHEAHRLVERGARFSFFVLLGVTLPILMETSFLLELWLGRHIEHLVAFTQLALLLSLTDALSNTLVTLQLATGRIRNYQLAVGGMQLLNFPLAYLCMKLNCPPESVYIVAIALAVVCLGLRLYYLRSMAQLPVGDFVRKVVGRCGVVTGCSVALPLLLKTQCPEGWVQFLIVTPTTLVCTLLASYWVGCDAQERHFIGEQVKQIRNKINRKQL